MEIDFTKAGWTMDDAGAWLKIQVPAPADAVRWLEQMEDGKTYTANLKRKVNRRSLDANGYYWVLCGKLAKKMNLPPDMIYRRHIRDIGSFEPYCMQNEAVTRFAQLWCDKHIGRIVETRESKIEGCTTVLAYYGSSDFDTQQMSHLIDNCIQDCKAVGIETRTDEEIRSLLEQWEVPDA